MFVVVGAALRIFAKGEMLTIFTGAILQGTGVYVLALMVASLTSYALERSLNEARSSGFAKAALVIIKYALPVIAAGATSFILSFGTPPLLGLGLVIFSMAAAGSLIGQMRNSNGRHLRYPALNLV